MVMIACHALIPSRDFPNSPTVFTRLWKGCSAELTAEGCAKVDELAVISAIAMMEQKKTQSRVSSFLDGCATRSNRDLTVASENSNPMRKLGMNKHLWRESIR